MLRLSAFLAAVFFTAQASAPSRPIVVIGDLHMGPGRDAKGNWHAVEDFRWRDEFVRFLEAINTQGGGNTDLVINGDLFELLQSPEAAQCSHHDPAFGCTVFEALDRLETAIRAHSGELAAIGKFAAAGANRVHVVAGDHDAALLVPEVWRRAAGSFAAPADRITLAASGSWRSPDGRVHVEHGHQLPLSADRFRNWPNPRLTGDGAMHLERPWGEQVVVPIYDRTESRYPIIDNIAEEGVGAKFVVAAIGGDLLNAAAPLLKLLLTKTTWQQFRMDLDDGEVKAPEWDLARIRGDLAAFVAGSLPADDPFAPLVKQVSPDTAAAVAATFSDAQIVATCDYRAAIRRARRRMERVLTQLAGVGPPIAECPRTPATVGPAFEYYWRTRDQQVTQHIIAPDGLDVIVFGHSHLLDRPFRPFGDDGPVVVTSGAWQRTVHPNDIKQLDAPLESLAPCYSFVRIPAGDGTRTTEPRSWRMNQDQWTIGNGGC
jgi:UDP-2,3-diacylglucosamine pyrophosphatase LpxH